MLITAAGKGLALKPSIAPPAAQTMASAASEASPRSQSPRTLAESRLAASATPRKPCALEPRATEAICVPCHVAAHVGPAPGSSALGSRPSPSPARSASETKSKPAA